MARVVDTDVVSFLLKGDTRAELYRPHLASPPFVLSFMTVAELRGWARQRDWGEARRRALEAYLARYVIWYANDALCDRWAEATDSASRGAAYRCGGCLGRGDCTAAGRSPGDTQRSAFCRGIRPDGAFCG